MKKAKGNAPATEKRCEECEHCTYILGGDSVCAEESFGTVKFIIDDWIPTEYYMQCHGEKFKEAGSDER